MSIRRIVSILQKTFNNTISYSTIRCRLHESKLIPYHLYRTPLLTDRHKKYRILFAHKFKNLDSSKIIFSDEKRFVLHQRLNSKNNIVWALHRSAKMDFPCSKYDVSVMVWGAICAKGTLDLVVAEGGIKSDQYQEILKKGLVKSKTYFPDGDFIFQQDGATCHTSKSTQAWLALNCPQCWKKGIWPAQSPDLNPIENIWAVMCMELEKRNIKSKDQLLQEIERVWNGFTPEFISRFCMSFNKRLKILTRNGGETVRT